MAKDFIGYQALADAALRGVVREALRRVEKQGLVGAHHFRVTFKTGFPGVEIPEFLREQYPDGKSFRGDALVQEGAGDSCHSFRGVDPIRRSWRFVRSAVPRSGRRRRTQTALRARTNAAHTAEQGRTARCPRRTRRGKAARRARRSGQPGRFPQEVAPPRAAWTFAPAGPNSRAEICDGQP